VTYRALAFTGVLCLALGGCAGDELDEVRTFVKNAHADRKPRVEPLPEIKVQEPFRYSAMNLADPFSAGNLKPQARGGRELRPDRGRRKEPLEDYPLDSLKMVGTLMRGKQAWAVVQAPDGTVHRAKIGDHLGQNFGMVTKITEEKIDLIELVQSSLGDWTERAANLALAE
jgi:type IV pilus assembly protein PilP